MLRQAKDLGVLLKGKASLIVLESWQENDAIKLVQHEARSVNRTLYRWSLTDGLATCGFGPRIDESGKPLEPEELLQAIKARNEGGIFALCDFHPFLDNNPKIIRLIKDIALGAQHSDKSLVFISHRLNMPDELSRYSVSAELALPNEQEIEQLIRAEARKWAQQNSGARVRANGKAFKALAAQMQGLPHADVSRLASHAIGADGAISEADIPDVQKAKFALLNREGLLSYEFDTEDMTQVGGLENLKQWLEQRRHAFVKDSGTDKNDGSNNAVLKKAAFKKDVPKDVLLLGVQGGGKSLAAKAIAGLWQLPLLRLDMGALYDKYIGETERNLRDTLKQAELMSPCVLWLDEIEKALGAGSDDGGLSRRLLGFLLTWMAERSAPVFVVATSNNIQTLPAELVRKGRFDEIFFVDLPNPEVREEIFRIHLAKREQNVELFDLSRLALSSDEFSGAEIEQAIVSGIYTADAKNRNLDHHLLIDEIEKTTPLAIVMAEQIMALKVWAEERAVPA